jgi:hypothetical protein
MIERAKFVPAEERKGPDEGKLGRYVFGNESPSKNYYFPMAKYRYLPRILRAWICVDQLAFPALERRDWGDLDEVFYRLDDGASATPLYAGSIEGGRKQKSKKRTPIQKELLGYAKEYQAAVVDLRKALVKKNPEKTKVALTDIKVALGKYRTLAQIDTEDGGVLDVNAVNAKSGSKLTGTGFVVPAFRGGGNLQEDKEAMYDLKKRLGSVDPVGPIDKEYDLSSPKALSGELEEDVQEFKDYVKKR